MRDAIFRSRTNLPDLVEAWLATQSSVNTRAAYRADLNVFGKWCAQSTAIPLAADTKTLIAFQAARRTAGDSDATVRRRWSSLASFYDHAIMTGAIDVNPVAGVQRPSVPSGNHSNTDVLSDKTVDDYLAIAAGLDPRLDALVSLLVFDGLKLGEALALDVDDINGRPPKTSLTIRRHGTSRRLVLTEASARAVRRCARRRSGEPLFTSASRATETSSARRLTRFGADHLIRQLSDGNPTRVTANALRRFFITSSHAAGNAIDEIQYDAGLSDRRGVRRYLDDPARAEGAPR